MESGPNWEHTEVDGSPLQREIFPAPAARSKQELWCCGTKAAMLAMPQGQQAGKQLSVCTNAQAQVLGEPPGHSEELRHFHGSICPSVLSCPSLQL